jgi:NAD(P)-dependent dehydrogenase (short-subunit alcohol dehydrogenase family)
MDDKVILVTGANAGIGRATALGLAKAGGTVVMLCRDQERGKEALADIVKKTGNRRTALMICDLASQRAIRAFAERFLAEHRRLDVLINNAAVLMPKRSITEDGIESTLAINHVAYFLLTELLLERLKSSAPSRIVNVASAAHTYGHIDLSNLQGERDYGGFRAYANSKLANILFTRQLARRLTGTGVTANCLHPGSVGTSLFRRLPKVLEAIIKLVTIGPDRGARTTIYLASSPEVEGVTGKYFSRSREVQSSLESRDDQLAADLWAVTEELTRQAGGTASQHA